MPASRRFRLAWLDENTRRKRLGTACHPFHFERCAIAGPFRRVHDRPMTAARTRPTTPDLFSHPSEREAPSSSENPPSSSLVVAKAVNNLASSRHVLPKNLTKAVGQLSDCELDLLHAATIEEMQRRGRLPPNVSAAPTSSPRPSELLNKPATRRTSVSIAEVGLTRGQINAVRAAFKAGVTPSRIARQFGISQANVRKALTTEGTKI